MVLWIRNNYGTTIVRTDKITQVKGRKEQTKKDSLLSVFSIWDKGIMLKTWDSTWQAFNQIKKRPISILEGQGIKLREHKRTWKSRTSKCSSYRKKTWSLIINNELELHTNTTIRVYDEAQWSKWINLIRPIPLGSIGSLSSILNYKISHHFLS